MLEGYQTSGRLFEINMIGEHLGKWVVESELGRGGMGRVYLAHEETPEGTGRTAAVKILAGELSQDTGFLHRFEREVAALSLLHHPHIVALYDSGEHEGIYYYAMEYVEGRNFEQVLQERRRLPSKEVVGIGLQVCPALKHAHDHGIIHRDIKLQNLMLTNDGVVKLMDFGIAKVFAGKQLTATGGLVGTAEYLSPEQAAGKPVTNRSDLYSLGVVFYTLLTGRTPFQGESILDLLHKHRFAQFDRPQRYFPDIPGELDDLVCKLLEKDPGNRPASGLVVQRLLESIGRKLERREEFTIVTAQTEATQAENALEAEAESEPGPATFMSHLMREELLRQNLGHPVSQLLRKVWFVFPLFLLCVGLIFWRYRPQRETFPEETFQTAVALLDSSNPEDWEKGWDRLEPLREKYFDRLEPERWESYRLRVRDYEVVQKTVSSISSSTGITEAQRFYRIGLARCQSGDLPGAEKIWRNVMRSFRDVESEKVWVCLAEHALSRLTRKIPEESERHEDVRKALENARNYRRQGRAEEATAIFEGLQELYRDDTAVQKVLADFSREKVN